MMRFVDENSFPKIYFPKNAGLSAENIMPLLSTSYGAVELW